MPRNGSGVYSPPPGSAAAPNTTILSTSFNALVDDLTGDANGARPIGAGGTGATSAAAARLNLAALSYEAQALSAPQQSVSRSNIGALAVDGPSFTGFMSGPRFQVDAQNYFMRDGKGDPFFNWDNGDYIRFDRAGNDYLFFVGDVLKAIIYDDGNFWSAAGNGGLYSSKSGILRWAAQAEIDAFAPASISINLGAGGAVTGFELFGGVNTDKRIGKVKWRSLQVLGGDGVTWFNVGQV